MKAAVGLSTEEGVRGVCGLVDGGKEVACLCYARLLSWQQ